jgi:hypothetical protein
MSRIISFASAAALCIIISSCSGSGSDNPVFGPKLLTPLAVRFPIDGVVDLAAVGTIHQKTIDILDNFGTGTVVKTATISWSARNDDRDLYLALEWNDDTQNSLTRALPWTISMVSLWSSTTTRMAPWQITKTPIALS